MTPEKKAAAIKWLTDEIRSLRMAPEINGCGPENWAEQLEVMETCLEAVRGHFVDTGKMVPLTLEQLRGMGGKPVWINDLGKLERSGWRLLYWDRGKYLVLLAKSATGYLLEDYGKTWIAYAYPPAHIDRETWTAEWIYPENEWNLPVCSKCGCNSKDATYGHKDNFCPKCGRAMTPEAWAMLEKRLRG